ncbi:ParB N-terminal domain-containing protein [Methylorubrum extorquens]|uniref:ParB N-terminal domain-containing protein n=1 Tax=Methylorubrum extorquens TaxID=408 RepID=A0AAX3WKK7_METEX|nr:ParB N-terminal domain-containing protein [Methylorubrum extorquens]
MRTDDPLRYAAIEIVEVRTLRGYDRNARTHSDEQVAQLAAAIQRFGFTNPILADDDGVIIAGHGRMAAARRLNLDRVPCIRVTGLTHYAPGTCAGSAGTVGRPRRTTSRPVRSRPTFRPVAGAWRSPTRATSEGRAATRSGTRRAGSTRCSRWC